MAIVKDQISFLPATPEAIRALTDNAVVLGLAWSDILAIVALFVSTATTIALYFAQQNLSRQFEADAEKRASERDEAERSRRALTSALDFHRDYNSDEMAKSRSGAIRFVRSNSGIDWINEPELSKFDSRDMRADDLFKLMRFFHRLNVFRQVQEVDIAVASGLLGSELAWWYGFAFELMERRSYSRTMGDIVKLAAAMKAIQPHWDTDVQRGRHERLSRP